MKNATVIAITSMLILLISCNPSKNDRLLPTKKNAIEFTEVKYRQPEEILRLPGELKPFNDVDIYARVNGFIKNINVDRGSQVKQGDLLCTIEAPELTAQLAEANAKIEAIRSIYYSSKATYDRLLQSSKTPGAISPNELEIAQSKMMMDSADVQSAKSEYDAIADMKNYLNVYAPFSGIITERNISPGTLVGKDKSSPMLKLKQEDRLRLVVAVPEKNTASIAKNQTISFTVDAYPENEFTAVLSRESGSVQQDIRSEIIEFDVRNTDHKLESGMYAEVNLKLQRADSTLFVPKTAVVSSTERTFVIRDSSGCAQWVDVKKGDEVADEIEIWGNISSGEKLVKIASEQMRNGKFLN